MKSAELSFPAFLDSYKNNRNKFCGSFSVYSKVPIENENAFKYCKVGCKCWRCFRCGPRRAKLLRKAIIEQATKHNLNRFLTLTLDPKTCNASESPKYIRECWAKFRTYLNRLTGGSITFITVLEFQSNGYAHLHVLIDRYIPFDWIQQAWQSLGGGKFVNIKQVDVHRIANYVSKYLTKELLLSDHFGKFRRFTSSRNIQMSTKGEKGVWRLVRSTLEYLRQLVGEALVTERRDHTGELDEFTSLIPISP